jgi:hypothetical protein
MIQSRVGGWQGTKDEGVRLRADEADMFFDPVEANALFLGQLRKKELKGIFAHIFGQFI